MRQLRHGPFWRHPLSPLSPAVSKLARQHPRIFLFPPLKSAFSTLSNTFHPPATQHPTIPFTLTHDTHVCRRPSNTQLKIKTSSGGDFFQRLSRLLLPHHCLLPTSPARAAARPPRRTQPPAPHPPPALALPPLPTPRPHFIYCVFGPSLCPLLGFSSSSFSYPTSHSLLFSLFFSSLLLYWVKKRPVGGEREPISDARVTRQRRVTPWHHPAAIPTGTCHVWRPSVSCAVLCGI